MAETRRSALLGAIAAASALLGGCATTPGASPGDSTETTVSSRTEQCTWPHYFKIFTDGREHQILARYEYENLSSAAQDAFENALPVDGWYEVRATTGDFAPEFEYVDVVSYYEIVYEGEVEVLGTRGGMACPG